MVTTRKMALIRCVRSNCKDSAWCMRPLSTIMRTIVASMMKRMTSTSIGRALIAKANISKITDSQKVTKTMMTTTMKTKMAGSGFSRCRLRQI